MMKLLIMIFTCLILPGTAVMSQELIITDFPVGVAGSVKAELFKPYAAGLQAIADTLHRYPLARAIVIGGADGEFYRDGHDAKNPGLALGRAHVLRNLLIAEYKVDSTQIVIQSIDFNLKAGTNRFASIRIDRALSDLEARLDSLESRPPVERHFTEVKEVRDNFIESYGLQLGGGLSTAPFGIIPIVTGSVTWKRIIFVEAVVGHTIWKSSYTYDKADLSTRRRMSGADLIVYPFERLRLGFVGGWVRIEEISSLYYQYVKLSEGPMIGVRYSPLEYLSITGSYNPAKHRRVGQLLSKAENDQFLLSVTVHKTFGGKK